MVAPTATMTETDLQAAVLELANLFGWRCAHFRVTHRCPAKCGRWSTWRPIADPKVPKRGPASERIRRTPTRTG
jgi:hypothetical protein